MWLRPFNRNGVGEPWASGYKLGETLCSKPIEWGVWRAILDTGKSVPPWRTQPIRSSGDRQCNQKYKTTVYAKCISYLFCILSKSLPNFAKLTILASSMLIRKWARLCLTPRPPKQPTTPGNAVLTMSWETCFSYSVLCQASRFYVASRSLGAGSERESQWQPEKPCSIYSAAVQDQGVEMNCQVLRWAVWHRLEHSGRNVFFFLIISVF